MGKSKANDHSMKKGETTKMFEKELKRDTWQPHHEMKSKSSKLQWAHVDAYDYAEYFSKNHFREPDVLANVRGGICIWYPKLNENFRIDEEEYPNVFSEHWCRDESILHHCPGRHHDYFYSFIKIKLDKDTPWDKVLSVSGSVSYDPLKALLSARCASIEANIATFYTCLNVLNNTPGYMDDTERPRRYAENINATSDVESVKKFYNYIVEKLHFFPTNGYWNIAFPEFKESGKCF